MLKDSHPDWSQDRLEKSLNSDLPYLLPTSKKSKNNPTLEDTIKLLAKKLTRKLQMDGDKTITKDEFFARHVQVLFAVELLTLLITVHLCFDLDGM